MTMRSRFIPLALAGAIAQILSIEATAADAPASVENDTALAQIVVTASKREEKLQDVAMSVTAVTGDDLLRRQSTSFVDFANQIPGLSLQAIDPSQTRLILRGANAGSVGATVATIIDDIPFSMSGAQADGSFFGSDVDTYDLSRVEVLRGPQGTLYGATAEGGLLKYVTNAPDPTKFEADAVVGGVVVDGGALKKAIVKGMVNIPLWDNKAAFRISAVEEGLPGWINDAATGQRHINDGSKYSVRASLLFKPVDDFSARLTIFNQHLNLGGQNAVEVKGAAADPLHPPPDQLDLVNGLDNSSPWPHRINTKMTYYALNLEYSLPSVSFMSSTSYGQVTHTFAGDFTNVNLAPGVTYGDYLGAVAYGQPIIMAQDQLESLHKFNQEFRAASAPGLEIFGHGFDWQGGIFYTHETTDLWQFFDARDPANPTTILTVPGVLGGADVPAYYKEYALYGDAVYHFSKAWDLDIGARQTHISQSSQVTTFCCILYGPATTPFAALSSVENNHTWSVAPRWHITDDTLLYARVATGYRPGGPNLPVPGFEHPPVFKSDSTRNYELGFKSTFLNNRVTIDTAIFDIEWKDIQILGIVNTDTGPVGINGNSGRAHSRGFEWNATWSPVQNLVFGFLGEYTNAKLTADAPGLGAHSGDKLPYVPEVSATFNADYKWHAFDDYYAVMGGSWSYVGNTFTSFSPSAGVVESHVKLPSYNTLRLNAGLTNERYSLEAYASNVTNKRAIIEYANNGGVNQSGIAVLIQPRTVGLQLEAKF